MKAIKAWFYNKTKKYYIKKLAERYPKIYVWYLEHTLKVAIDFQKTCGYFKNVPPIGKLFQVTKHGVTVTYECTDVKYYGDPEGMIDHIYYCILGIAGVPSITKAIKDCDFIEFLKMYEPYFTLMTAPVTEMYEPYFTRVTEMPNF